MHGLIIFVSLSVALGAQWIWQHQDHRASHATWSQRWQWAWLCLVLPPLVLIMTAIAILLMGPRGQMVWRWEGWAANVLALSFLVFCLMGIGQSIWAAWQALRHLHQYSTISVCGQQGRYVHSPIPLAACIGFWHSELLVSQGLLDRLSPAQVNAVLIHEQAHQHYRDTFWFFWWGWLRRITRWLPYTEALWQELLLLRELRADQWASHQTDGLLLAESLVLMVQAPSNIDALCVPFGEVASHHRLNERIEALLTTDQTNPDTLATPLLPKAWVWGCLLLALLPLLSVPFHY